MDHVEFAGEIGPAIFDFRGKRFVGWRGAAADGGDEKIRQSQPVFAIDRLRLIRETRAIQAIVEKIARAVAGEHSAGAIAAVSGRREADDEQSRCRIAEAGTRLSPIVFVAKGATPRLRHLLAVTDQARAFAAADDAFLEYAERFALAGSFHRTAAYRKTRRRDGIRAAIFGTLRRREGWS